MERILTPILLLAVFLTSSCRNDDDAGPASAELQPSITVENDQTTVATIHYTVTNTSSSAVTNTDAGRGTWQTYTIKDTNGNMVWPPQLGALSTPTSYTINAGDHITDSFTWDGTTYPAFTKQPGQYTISIHDIFQSHVSTASVTIIAPTNN